MEIERVDVEMPAGVRQAAVERGPAAASTSCPVKKSVRYRIVNQWKVKDREPEELYKETKDE